jgi:predicted P-loop ATPase/GTPase
MSEIETIQKLLEVVITRIEDIEDKIKSSKTKNSSDAVVELRELKKALSVQLRVKITLIKSIEEITSASNTLTLYTPLKPGNTLFSKIKRFFGGT